ncbi:MAG: ornithine carbamoyltransferase [Candidatus Magnetoovum sp. WYHC-5]|nr:ornithine carbamoyltransferase [Candidatus Magnetoovum sp. WYHC-5]
MIATEIADHRDFLTVWDFTTEEILKILDIAFNYKKDVITKTKKPLDGKCIGLIFEKSSTRTRLSFEVGIYQLGGCAVYIRPEESHIGKGESIGDTARVLSRFFHGIVFRTFGHERVEELARYASIPVINGLTDSHHPCQAVADMFTIKEKRGSLNNIKLSYIGDGNNVANSLLEITSRLGVDITIACPTGYEPDKAILEKVMSVGNNSIEIIHNPFQAVKNADVIYTDVWVSMGDKTDGKKKKEAFKDFQVNEALLSNANEDVLVLHCLPAHRGEEITDDVIDGPKSAVFDQAENRLHTQKAILEMLIK